MLMQQFRRAKALRMMASPVRTKNRLAAERSPYLQQHATNPVDWYPWGEEAFEKAKKENKPIFLSVGYSTCHWCHVMERESFENEKIGALLNEHYVSIKVDREERPDVDKVYMTFIQAISGGGGGWPMSVWLTPQLKPFFGGTYFPPTSVSYRPGFAAILTDIARQWKEKQGKISEQSTAIVHALQENAAMSAPKDAKLPSRDCIHQSFRQLHERFDAEHGGFGSSPKFPQPTTFNFLFRVYATDPSSGRGTRSLEMSLFTLKAMANGGIHDHVAQGFHRYSTDRYWHVPHFEKMLYDQAQLCVAYIDAYQITGDEFFADVARDILTYVSRDLSDEEGGFYSAEDADSYPTAGDAHKREGAFCVWTADEINLVLTDIVKLPEGASTPLTMSHVFCEYYGVKRSGNVSPDQDPHKELTGKNVLIVRHSVSELAEKFNISEEKVSQCLHIGRQKLFDERKKRPKPHRDNKIITSWNGLMISGFARAAQALGDASYLERAEKAARYVQSQLFVGKTLKRNSYRDPEINQLSVSKVDGFADDYAFLIHALLDLYEASFNEDWIKWAVELQEIQNTLFWDEVHSGYYGAASGDSSLLMRMKEDHDGAEPSANSVSAYNLVKLAALVERKEWRERAEKLFTLFSDRMEKVGGLAVPEMVGAFTMYLHTPAQQIIIAGDPTHDDTKSMLECVHSMFLPNKILIVHQDNSPDSYLKSQLQSLKPLKPLNSKAAAYVCKDFTCSLPTTNVSELRRQLNS